VCSPRDRGKHPSIWASVGHRLIDDLLIVTATLSRILNDVHPDVVRSHWSGKGDVLEAAQRVTLWSEQLFTGRVRKALVSAR